MKWLYGGLVCLLCASTPLAATTISFPFSFSPASTDFLTSTSVTQFNPALGTLNQITFDLTGLINGTQQADSEDPSSQNVSLNTSVLMTLMAGGNSLLSVNPSVSNPASLTGDTDAAPDFIGTDSATFSFTNVSTSNSTSTSNAVLLTLFTGAGSTGLDLQGVGTANASGGANLALLFSTTGEGNGQVTYDYSEFNQVVPEPTTFALAGSLLLGLGLFRRRRPSQ